MLDIFFKFLLTLKMYHWNTLSYARHKASDDCFGKILDLLDTFIEAMLGKYGTESVFDKYVLKIGDIHISSDKEMVQQILEFSKFLERLDIQESELLNIRDEMLSNIEKTMYLFTLK